MKLSLPLRIVLVHLVFMVALGGLGAWRVQREFQRYKATWESKIEALPTERMFAPLAREVARSLLLRLETGAPESRRQHKSTIGSGLDEIMTTLPGVDRLTIVDTGGRVAYTNDPLRAGMSLSNEIEPARLGSETSSRREISLPSGETVTEVILPLFDRPDPATNERRRLGAVVVRYRDLPDDDAGTDPAGPGPYDDWAHAVGRALLLDLETGESESQKAYKIGISEGLNQVLRALPIETLAIVDRELRIQYINDPSAVDLGFTAPWNSLFAMETPVRIPPPEDGSSTLTELMVPVFDRTDEEGQERRRLGSVLASYRPDPQLIVVLPELTPPSVGTRDFLQPLLLFVVLAVGSGIVLAALTILPVRKMERVLADFRERGFKGGLDADQVGLPKDLASTVQAISELGEKLAALDEQGKERETLLATLSKSLEDGMIAIDTQGTPVAWNPAALRILGVTGDEDGEPGNGSPAELARLRSALTRNRDLDFVAENSEAGTPFEVEIDTGGNARALARVTKVPLGEGVLLFIRDLAALRKVETHLLEAGRFAVLAHLTASLAHEIRNPLHSIQLSSAVVEQYVDLSGDTKESRAVAESLDSIKSEARRLTELLNNYLGMVHPGAESGPVDLRDLCRRVAQLVDYEARKANVEIRLEGEEHLPVVHGLPSRLQQAILNLVLNAIQAMPDGGTVTLSTSSSIGVVRLTVSDTGPGLPQELADQLFDTRVTTKPSGSGLGLPLVRLITEAHGGGVWYRSAPGRGASFTMVLPTHPFEASTEPRAVSAGPDVV